ncbi:MAG: MBL fold metallo-hydrolase [Thermoplasmataceae archaeon]
MGAAAVTMIEDDKRIIVDTGHFGNRDALVSRMKELDISASDIDVVVLTHLNWDHCLNVDIFKDSEIMLGKDEFLYGTLSGTKDDQSESFKNYLSHRRLNLVEDGQIISEHVKILSSPGHTSGHISVAVKETNKLTIIAGDSIPNLRSYRRGVPDLIFYNLDRSKESIEKIKSMNPDVIMPGHDPPFNEKGYLETDDIDIILRNEYESNSVYIFKKTKAEKPVIYND